MLDQRERRIGEKRLKLESASWFERVGLDWVGIVLALLILLTAVPFSDSKGSQIFASVVAGFILGAAIARLFVEREVRLLGKLYREAKEREGAAR